MFSRNNNTRENYSLEQKRNATSYNYIFYSDLPQPKMQGNGLGVTKIHPSFLSDNYIDIDSNLKGIGSCNFITPQPNIEYRPKRLPILNVYEKKEETFPSTFAYYQNERPLNM